MKIRTILGTLIAGVLLASPVLAQNVTDAVELTRSVIQTDRKLIVTNALQMTEAESQAFWPVYNEYWLEMNKVLDKRAKLILDYAGHYGTTTDAQAETLLNDYFKMADERLKLQKKYIKKFKKALPAAKVARYYQVENKLDAIINLELAAEIPLIR